MESINNTNIEGTSEAYEFQVQVLEEALSEEGITYPDFVFCLIELVKELADREGIFKEIELASIPLTLPDEFYPLLSIINKITVNVFELENRINKLNQ